MSNVPNLLKQLIKTEIKPNTNFNREKAQEYENFVSKSFNLLIKILGSGISFQPVVMDNMDKMIREELVNDDINKSVVWSQLYSQFKENRQIKQKYSILHLLKRISEHNKNFEVSASFPTHKPTVFMVDEEGSENEKTSSSSSFPMNENRRSPEMERNDPNRILMNPPRREEDQLLSKFYNSYKENTSYDVSEDMLLRDVVYTLQGIDGQFVKYDNLRNGFIIDNEIGASPNVRDSVRRLGELGWMYRRISDFVNDDSFHEGLILQSFVSSMSSQLGEYFKFIANFESQLSRLSLRKLLLLSLEQIEKMKILLILIDGCREKKGGEIISTIHGYTQHGDPKIKEIVLHILDEICAPLFHFLKKWMFEGVLIDPHQEFFVERRTDIGTTTTENKWKHEYVLNERMIPCFFSHEIAEKILRIGKSTYFLREYRREESIDEFRLSRSSSFMLNQDYIHSLSKNMKISQMEEFSILIAEICRKVDGELLNFIFNKYNFVYHLHALQKYMLFGEGDFVQTLLKLSRQELNKPLFQIDQYALPGIMVDVIRNSNAKYEPEFVQDRLQILLLSSNQNQQRNSNFSILGWDAFSLYYHFDEPLNNIWDKKTIFQYQRIFRFLWRMKRVDYLLSSSFKKLNLMLKRCQRKELYQILALVHPTTLYRHEMQMLVNNLQHFYMYEIIEKEWQKLIQKTIILKKNQNRNGNLDELIKLQYEFPLRIIKKGFLNKGNAVQEVIKKILNLVHVYLTNQKQLCVQIQQLILEEQLEDDDEEENEKRKTNMKDENDEEIDSSISSLMKTVERMERINIEYRKRVGELSKIKPQMLIMFE